ncbi:multidrug resistance-associated ABC transporter [Mycena filopes]|nr:multidrug resistance-associated ABC transporter [Mycena filopes]
MAFDTHFPSDRRVLFAPACASVISASILVVRWIFAPIVPSPAIGSGTIFRFRAARLLGCLGLLASSTYSSAHEDHTLVLGTLVAAPYLYGAILAFLSLNPAHAGHRLVRHANCVLLVPLAVYLYRDVFPLATYTRTPADPQGPELWTRIALLVVTAVVIPVFTPRQYIPVDPLNPMPVMSPVQTASIFSFAFYFFLDPITFLAYRQSGLEEHQLYPLSDTDTAAHLKSRSFRYLDKFSGAQAKHHLFFGLMRVFWREFLTLAGLILVRVAASYSGPLAMNRLLEYLETRDHTSVVIRPWVWIALIFFGPVLGSLSFQLYIFMNTRIMVRTESIITQLVFAHSLRIRVKSETTAADGADSVRTTAASSDDGTATAQASIKSAASKKPLPTKEPKKSDDNLVAKIMNLVTTDLGNIVDNRDFLFILIFLPLQISVGIWFLYVLLGWSVVAGVASIVLLAPVPGYMAKLSGSIQKERLKRTDGRVQSVSEAVNVLRMVKLFGWEEKMKARIGEKRDEELVYIKRRRVLDMVSNVVNLIIPVVVMVVTYGTYTLIMGQPLNASKVFSSMTIFDLLRDNIGQLSYRLNTLMAGKVSVDRVDDFLKKTELLDAFEEKETPVPFTSGTSTDDRIGFRNTSFSWSNAGDGAGGKFKLKIDGEVLFERGKINLVVGPTGSGKTSLLMALLGEMHWLPSSPDSWYNLPRGSGVAYATQESWVLNETIRSNIVFNTPFEEERYQKVLYQCALEPDLALFHAGDETEVGEKGPSLSGGQKARLTLARAVYSNATILLFDDILAALDVHTAQWIVEKCLGGDLIKNRTVILVTHNIALTHRIAHSIATLGSDGRVRSQVSGHQVQQVVDKIQSDVDEIQIDVGMVDPVPPVPDTAKPAEGKLIVAEEIPVGHVSSSALNMYFLAMGGKYPSIFFTLFFAGLILNQTFVALRTWMLGYWARQYDVLPADQVDVVLYLSTFIGIVVVGSIALAAVFIYLVSGQLRASKIIHKDLIDSILRAPLRWLDVTPTSRILQRVTSDVRAVDDALPNHFWPLNLMIVSMIVKLAAVVLYAPVFFVPSVLVGIAGAWIGQIYITGQLPVKRLMSNTRAPVLAHFGAAIAGLVSIRAFGAQSKTNVESLTKIDRYTRAARNYYDLNRWVGIRIDILGALFAASLTAYLVYIKQSSAGETGFLVNQAITFCELLLWTVRYVNEFEIQGNSLERIQAYVEIEHEKVATDAGKPPAYWPASGELRVEGLSARYSEDGPEVLHNISFAVKPGERIGIVGRTGSGKSSLTLALLRCIPTEGSVRYDGIETSELNLDALRSSITIIPQVPELLSGSLRANLDPFGQYDDAELNFALRAAGLFALQNEMDEGRLTLESTISSGGANLSVGERQVLALARAIIRKSKILILDEATSAIDYTTDSIIQHSLREELPGDVSIITVAHRLQTIMDADKIMVLDAGNIVEFDSPKELLKIKDGKLLALVEESGDRDALFAMAGAA